MRMPSYLDGLLARVHRGVKGEAAQPKEATITLIPYNLHPCDARWNRSGVYVIVEFVPKLQ
jgi:hypothetical protein